MVFVTVEVELGVVVIMVVVTMGGIGRRSRIYSGDVSSSNCDDNNSN